MKSFTEAFDFIKALAGVNNFTTQEKSHIKILLNRRLKVAYNAHEAWKEYTVTGEERFLAPSTITVTATTASGTIGNTLYWGGMHGSSPIYVNATPVDVSTGVLAYPVLWKSVDSSISGSDYSAAPGEWFYGPAVTMTTTDFNFIEPWTATVGVGSNYSSIGSRVQTTNLSLGSAEFEQPDYSKETPYPHLTTNTWPTGITVEGSDMKGVPYNEQLVGLGTTPFTQPYQKDEVGVFQRVFKEYPYAKKSSIEYDFHVTGLGLEPLNLIGEPTSLYVTYKKKYEDQDFTDETKTVIPNTFFQYASYATYADFLRFDGQLSKAIIEEEIATDFLQTEMEKVDIMNNSNLNFKVQTHTNTQSR
jgi:hypothetical protein